MELASKVASVYTEKFDPVSLGKTHKGKPQECVAGANVFFIQSTFAPMDQMLESLKFIQLAQRRAHKVNVVIPYFGFSPQTRYDDVNDLSSFLITAGADRILSMDIYADMCKEFSDIPVEQMYVAPLFAKYLQESGLSNVLIVAPGEWASKRAKILKQGGVDAQVVSCDIEKKNNKIEKIVFNNHCHFRGKNVVLLKEVLHTAETTVALADHLKTKGVAKICAMAAHAMFSQDAVSRIDNSCIEKLVITDSLPLCTVQSPKIQLISVAETIANKIHEIASTSKN
jgi:ribose-phosphate pyrophosphokinase